MITLKTKFTLIFILFFSLNNLASGEHNPNLDNPKALSEDVLGHIISNNTKHLKKLDKNYFNKLGVMPRVTLLTCCDSRIDIGFFDSNRINDFFVIRNVGNQISTSKESVEYGIRNMNTPVLFILGHSDCAGATLSVTKQNIPEPYYKENITKDPMHIIENVNKQVSTALTMYDDLVKDQKLVVIGAVYDFQGDFGHGKGKLIIVNINGEKSPKPIKNNYYLKNALDIATGHGISK